MSTANSPIERTENEGGTKMKLYKVTTTDRYNRNWVYTVSADSEREALWKVKANAISSGETVSIIEEVR
jgi:hypothetical protein